jgi:hypothetical protein
MTIVDTPSTSASGASLPADREIIQSWPHSGSFGVRSTGAAIDRRSLFAAAGVVWDDRLFPPADDPRGSDYPFSYDVSNGRVLAAVDSAGFARRVVQGEGMRSVEGESIPGVYVEKEFAYVEGRFGVQPATAGPVTSTLLGDVIPAFLTESDGLIVRRAFNVRGDHKRSTLRCTVILDNTSPSLREIELTLVSDASGDAEFRGSWVDGSGSSRRLVAVQPNEVVTLAADFSFSSVTESEKGSARSLITELDDAIGVLRSRYGSMSVPDGQWYADFVVRSAELARQSSLHSEDGSSIGSFWGSNATPIPDVWTRDLFYTALSSAQFDLDDAVGTIDFLARTALPRAPWGKENEVDPRDDGLSHSLGNAVTAVALAGLTARTFGTEAVLARTSHLASHCRELAKVLLVSRPETGDLYPSHYISDGPSRGDFHTGSNVLTWYALNVLTDLGQRVGLDEGQIRQLGDVAAQLKATIRTRCVTDGPGGEKYSEGVNRDGSIVAGHDGEESDLTLASSYGFASRFDPRIVRHARSAFTVSNPYFDVGAGGVTFWDWDDYNGVTFPAYIHKLAGAENELELTAPLEDIRRLTDLDGSLWWWPQAHRASDPFAVKRGLGKCGWCAGAFVQRFVHDIIGVRRFADEKALLFSPAVPWNAFVWNQLPFRDGTIGVEYTRSAQKVWVGVRNETGGQLTVTLDAPVPRDALVEDILIDGENGRYRASILDEDGRVVVRCMVVVEPGRQSSLEVQISSSATQRR